MKPIEIGNVIKYHRKQSGLTQQELANLAGVGKTAVFDIEKGKESVQLNTLIRVLDILNIHITLDTPLKSMSDE